MDQTVFVKFPQDDIEMNKHMMGKNYVEESGGGERYGRKWS